MVTIYVKAPEPPPGPVAVNDYYLTAENTTLGIGMPGVLTNDYKLKASDVKCPDSQPVKAGSTFTCTVSVDGAQKNVQITVKSDDGHYEVGQPQ